VPADKTARLLAALEDSARQRGVKAAGDNKKLVALAESGAESVRPVACRLAGCTGWPTCRPVLLALGRNEKARLELRLSAIDALASLGGAPSRDALVDLASKGGLKTIRQQAVIALAGVDLEVAAKQAKSVLLDATTGEGVPEVVGAFLQRKNGAAVLAKALTGGKLPEDAARAGIRTVRTSGRDAGGLGETLAKAGGLTFGAKVLPEKELKEMVAEVAKKGDPARGKRSSACRPVVYALPRHLGRGGQVGPDLSSIGAAAQIDYLIESLLQPSKAIKENYHALLVTTTAGQQFTGIKVAQTPTSLVLRTDQDKEIAIPLKDVEEQTRARYP